MGHCLPRRVNKRDGNFCSDAIQLVTVDCCCPLSTVSTDCPPPGWCPSTVQFTHDDSCDYSSCPSQSPTYGDGDSNGYDHSADDHSGYSTPKGDEDCEEREGTDHDHDHDSDYDHDFDSDDYDTDSYGTDSDEDEEDHAHPHWDGKGAWSGDYAEKGSDNGDDCEEGVDDHPENDSSYNKKH